MIPRILFLYFFTGILFLGSPKFSALKSLQNNIIDTSKSPADSSTTNKNFPSTRNNIVKDSISGMPMLIGKCTRGAFNDTSFSWWWKSEYDLYDIDSAKLKEIKNDLRNRIFILTI